MTQLSVPSNANVCVIYACIFCVCVCVCVSQGAPGMTGQVGAQGVNGSRVKLLLLFIILELACRNKISLQGGN